MCMPCRNGKKRWGMYRGVGGALLLPLLLAVRTEIEGFVPIILRAWAVHLLHWVSLRPCTALSLGAGLIC